MVLGIDIKFADIKKTKGLGDETFYGYFGIFHVLERGIGPRKNQTFASLLKSNNFDLTSISCVNVGGGGEMYIPLDALYLKSDKSTLLEVDGQLMLIKWIKDLKKASEGNSIMLFNLNKEDSPYNNGQRLVFSIPSIYPIMLMD